MIVLTTPDKDKRDKMFAEFKASDDKYERQAVKFSGVEPVLDELGVPLLIPVRYALTGHVGRTQFRGVYRTTWSVAYPE